MLLLLKSIGRLRTPCFCREDASDLAQYDPFLASIAARLGGSGGRDAWATSAGSPFDSTSTKQPSAPSGQLRVDIKMWLITFEDLALCRQIGRGSFGRVSLKNTIPGGGASLVGEQ